MKDALQRLCPLSLDNFQKDLADICLYAEMGLQKVKLSVLEVLNLLSSPCFIILSILQMIFFWGKNSLKFHEIYI